MLTLDFSNFPTLHTPRLTLRQSVAADAQDLFALRSDPEVMRYIPRAVAQSVDDVHALLNLIEERMSRGEAINWAIEWKGTGEVVGLLGFVNFKAEHDRAEVGYSLSRAWHRRGIVSEALNAMLGWGFDTLNLHSVEAIVDAENVASLRLLEKAGFRQEAHFIEDFLWDGRYRNSVHFGMLKSEWDAQRAQ